MIPWEKADESLKAQWCALQEVLMKDDEVDGGTTLREEAVRAMVENTSDLTLLAQILDENDQSLLCWSLKGNAVFAAVVVLLVDASNEALHTANSDGKIPLHIAIEQKVTLDVIQALVTMDVVNFQERSFVPVQTYSQDCASMEVVDMLHTATSSERMLHRTILEQDMNGRLPLHTAIEQGSSFEVVKLLLEADSMGQTVRIPDDDGNLPLHSAIRIRASSEIVQLLLEADHKKKTISLRVLRLLIKRYPQKQDWFDKYMAEPLLRSLLEKPQETRRQPERSMYSLGLKSTSFESEATGSPEDPGVPVAVFPMLARSIARSRELQRLVNEKSAERKVVAVFLEDLYANCFLIAFYLISTDNFLNAQDGVDKYFVTLFLLVAYFLFREIVQVTFHQEQYLFNAWNFFELGRIVLVLASAIYMSVHQQAQTIDVVNPVPHDEPAGTSLLAWTGAVVFLGMVSFLRSTALSFSYFVNGVFDIFLKLLPFFVGTALVLWTFAYLYFVDRFYFVEIVNGTCVENTDEDVPANFCTLGSAFYAVYGYMIAGPEQTTTALDLIFGLVVVIILLNVLIAIVTTAWEKSSEHVADDFWLHRISFLSEQRLLLESIDKLVRKRWQTVLDKIDTFGEKRLFDKIPWEEKPYRFVWINREYYHNPESLTFDSSLDDKVVKEWRLKLKRLRSYEADMKFAGSRKERMNVIANCFGFILTYSLILFPLGIVTFGYMWPSRLRMFLFGNSVTKEVSYTVKREIKELKSDMEKDRLELKEEIREMHELLASLVSSKNAT